MSEKADRKKKGFLLFEVVVSIVIITTGMLFVMRAYSSAKNSIVRSSDLFTISLLAENKMWEFEEKEAIEETRESGDFGKTGYSWLLTAQPLKGLELNISELSVFREKDRDKTKYSISTYLRNKIE